MWDNLYTKHQMRDSDITSPDRGELYEEQDEIAQIVTGKGRHKSAKTKAPTAKGHRGIGVGRAVTCGSLMVAISATIALSITLELNLVVVLFVVPPNTTPRSVNAQWVKPKSKTVELGRNKRGEV